MSEIWYLYITTDSDNKNFFVGFSNNLFKELVKNNKAKQKVKLVFFEEHQNYEDVVKREKYFRGVTQEYLRKFLKLTNPKLVDYFEILDQKIKKL